MRFSKQISTELLIESQSGGDPQNPTHLQTLIDNAVRRGIPTDDVEAGYCTDAEHQAMVDAKDVAVDLANPMDTWKRTMAQTDSSMPRYLEDHITDGHDGDASNEFLQVKYDAKIKLRATKP